MNTKPKRWIILCIVATVVSLVSGIALMLNDNYSPGSMSVDRNGNPVPAEGEGYDGAYIQKSNSTPPQKK